MFIYRHPTCGRVILPKFIAILSVLHKAHFGHTPAITIYYSTFLRFCQEKFASSVYFYILHKLNALKLDYLPHFSILYKVFAINQPERKRHPL